MLTRNQKEEIVNKLSDEIKSSKSVVFTDYKGVGVKDMESLRGSLREEGARIQVIKKKLVEIALKNAGIEMSAKDMEGQLAVAISQEDEVTPAKVINNFAKENENLKIIGGLLDSKKLNSEEVISLAKLPSKEELLAKLVGTLNAPMSGFVNVLQGNQRSLVQALKAIADNK